ncbi:unnamed protein product [Pocillopora meandrina]|uniref:Apyrase n=1 Tax=Pocillopora meandrina TaxID=46732 RepID=A0AAU9XFU2_9CNID|nr:unnamed protein product [Pocillopora meandrina]
MKTFSEQVLLSFLYLLVVSQSIPVHQDTGHNSYAILFDAGSSGTRMEIYKFLASGPSLQPSDVVQIDASPDKVKPGISDLSDDPTQVEAYMNPLLKSAKQTIPEDKQASTPIFLLATAGMRLLPEDQANAILDEVRKLFNDKEKCPFLFKNDNDVRIITGKVEGIYGWVTVNFLLGVFASKNSNSYGSLDLGGASHQNSMDFDKSSPEVIVFDVAGKTYSVFSRSYLGYGQDQAREKYLAYIAQKANCAEDSKCVVQSPCHNNGFKESLEYQDKENIGAVCSDCEENTINPGKIRESSESFCEKDYSEVSEDPFAKDNCFGANYIYELLTEGYGLSGLKKITVTNSLNGFSLGWTLGGVLHNTGILNE